MSDFKAKIHPIRFQRSPQRASSCIQGGLLLRRGEGRGRGREGRGERIYALPVANSWLRRWSYNFIQDDSTSITVSNSDSSV